MTEYVVFMSLEHKDHAVFNIVALSPADACDRAIDEATNKGGYDDYDVIAVFQGYLTEVNADDRLHLAHHKDLRRVGTQLAPGATR